MPITFRRRSRRPTPAALVAVVLAVVFAGCARAESAPPFVERDSAGVRIVESLRPQWAEGEGWRLSTEPTLQIGVIDGDPAYQLSSVSGAFRLADGRIVVADRATAQLRFFGADGAHLRSVGGPGEGPGEFATLTRVVSYRGDSILVWDSRARRATVFDQEGRLGRLQSVRPPDPPGGVTTQGTGSLTVRVQGSFQGAFADGSLVSTATAMLALDLGSSARPDVVFMRMTPEGEPERELGTFAGPGLGFGDAVPRPFADGFERLVEGQSLYVGTGTGGIFEIEVRAADGSRERLIRAQHRDVSVTQAHRDGYLEGLRGTADDPQAVADLERTIAQIEFPASHPAYTDLMVDAEGHLWVADYPTPGVDGPRSWSVFAPEGHLLGDVEMPEAFEVEQIGRDFVLGVWTDELDVPFVRLYALERP